MPLQQSHTVPGNANASEDLGLTTAVANGACFQVCEFINTSTWLDLTYEPYEELRYCLRVKLTLDFGFSKFTYRPSKEASAVVTPKP